MFDKNTVLSAGISYADDTVVENPPGTTIAGNQAKDSVDLALGVSQIITKKTVVDCNFTYGHSDGYLSDPYRTISRYLDFGGVSYPIYGGPENRPDTRDRFALKVTGKQYFEQPGASLVAAYRIFSDTDGIVSNTLDFSWNQEVGEHVIIATFIRFYDQSAADYYYPIVPEGVMPAHYSSDYRVAAFQSLNYGVSLDYQVNEWLAMNFKIARYEMSGTSSETPSTSSLFPTANIISVGFNVTY